MKTDNNNNGHIYYPGIDVAIHEDATGDYSIFASIEPGTIKYLPKPERYDREKALAKIFIDQKLNIEFFESMKPLINTSLKSFVSNDLDMDDMYCEITTIATVATAAAQTEIVVRHNPEFMDYVKTFFDTVVPFQTLNSQINRDGILVKEGIISETEQTQLQIVDLVLNALEDIGFGWIPKMDSVVYTDAYEIIGQCLVEYDRIEKLFEEEYKALLNEYLDKMWFIEAVDDHFRYMPNVQTANSMLEMTICMGINFRDLSYNRKIMLMDILLSGRNDALSKSWLKAIRKLGIKATDLAWLDLINPEASSPNGNSDCGFTARMFSVNRETGEVKEEPIDIMKGINMDFIKNALYELNKSDHTGPDGYPEEDGTDDSDYDDEDEDEYDEDDEDEYDEDEEEDEE